MREVNKLVRDKIPAIIRGKGETPIFRVITDDEEYLQALFAKGEEELQEVRENPCLEELADDLERLRATVITLGFTMMQFEEERQRKAEARGGFEGRIFLERIE
jgi:predicted house-cleaning noncanonical NTP pyrophosphatase (MazG superfamily)